VSHRWKWRVMLCRVFIQNGVWNFNVP